MLLRQRVDPINLVGDVVSVGMIVYLKCSPVRGMASKAVKLAVPFMARAIHVHAARTPSVSSIRREIFTPRVTFAAPVSSAPVQFIPKVRVNALPIGGTVEVKAPKPAPKPEPKIEAVVTVEKPLLQTPTLLTPTSNGCPKNLAYFTMRPRPKLTPEECFSCKKLITCVCLTSN